MAKSESLTDQTLIWQRCATYDGHCTDQSRSFLPLCSNRAFHSRLFPRVVGTGTALQRLNCLHSNLIAFTSSRWDFPVGAKRNICYRDHKLAVECDRGVFYGEGVSEWARALSAIFIGNFRPFFARVSCRSSRLSSCARVHRRFMIPSFQREAANLGNKGVLPMPPLHKLFQSMPSLPR